MPKKHQLTRQKNAQIAARNERLRRVEKAYLAGMRKPADLAEKFGVSASTIATYIRKMKEGWREETTEEQRHELLEKMWHLYEKAMQSYERSLEDNVTETVTARPQKCPACAGCGYEDPPDNTVECSECEGLGVRVQEETQRRVQGQVGDASFLKEARAAMMEISKLTGMDVKQVEVKGQINHAHIHATPQDLFPGASDDDIIAAKLALERVASTDRPALPAPA